MKVIIKIGLCFFVIFQMATATFPHPQSTLITVRNDQDGPQNLPPPMVLPGHEGGYRVSLCSAWASKRVQPIYPPEAQSKGIKGNVVVKVFVNKKGRVESARALSGPAMLKQAAVEAARQWEFPITRVGGKPIKTTCPIRFFFPVLEPMKKGE
jgi:TonB family protein